MIARTVFLILMIMKQVGFHEKKRVLVSHYRTFASYVGLYLLRFVNELSFVK